MFLLTLFQLDCNLRTKAMVLAYTFSSETKTKVHVDLVLAQKCKPNFSSEYSGLVYEQCHLIYVACLFLSKSINNLIRTTKTNVKYIQCLLFYYDNKIAGGTIKWLVIKSVLNKIAPFLYLDSLLLISYLSWRWEVLLPVGSVWRLLWYSSQVGELITPLTYYWIHSSLYIRVRNTSNVT